MRFGSLFSGIGGFDLGLERAGMECAWQVEIDDYATKVLEKHWPDTSRYRDVWECGSANLESVDLICGGFPCQPVSHAGKQEGQNDERWLWPEFARIIGEIKPKWVLGENVPGLLSNDSGRLFGGILRDLAALGYNVEWNCIPASYVGAPHIRDRVWIIAHALDTNTNSAGPHRTEVYEHGGVEPEDKQVSEPRSIRKVLADTDCPRESQSEGSKPKVWGRTSYSGEDVSNTDDQGLEGHAGIVHKGDQPRWLNSLPIGQVAYEGVQRGGGFRWGAEPSVGRVVDEFPGRVDQLKCLGNAVVPKLVEMIGKWIMEADQ